VVVGLIGLFINNKPGPNPVVSQLKEAIQQPSAAVQRRWPYAMTPERWPTEEEFDRAMNCTQEGNLHFGVSGVGSHLFSILPVASSRKTSRLQRLHQVKKPPVSIVTITPVPNTLSLGTTLRVSIPNQLQPTTISTNMGSSH